MCSAGWHLTDRAGGGWNVFVDVMEFIREEPLEGELRRRIAAALRAVDGVTAAEESAGNLARYARAEVPWKSEVPRSSMPRCDARDGREIRTSCDVGRAGCRRPHVAHAAPHRSGRLAYAGTDTSSEESASTATAAAEIAGAVSAAALAAAKSR